MNKNTELINYTDAIKAIKFAILQSQYKTAALANKEMLSLYYGIGKYVSDNSRKGFWGTGAIEQISELLQKELPGLRGFSAPNIKKMRVFFEEWHPAINRSLTMNDLNVNPFWRTPYYTLKICRNFVNFIRNGTLARLFKTFRNL
jgi:hypothetical protein